VFVEREQPEYDIVINATNAGNLTCVGEASGRATAAQQAATARRVNAANCARWCRAGAPWFGLRDAIADGGGRE
jgi:hypothetical protein